MHGGPRVRILDLLQTPQPLPDDIKLTVTCFNAVIKNVLKHIFVFIYIYIYIYIELRYCQYLSYGLTFEIK